MASVDRCRHADHGEQRRAVLQRMGRQRRRQRQRRRGAADRRGAAGQQAEQPWKPSSRAATIDTAIVSATDTTTSSDRTPAQRRHLAERDAQAQQRDADAQHLARGELDARRARPVARQEVHRHAQQQREQHDRRAVVLGQEGRGRGDHGAGQHAGTRRAPGVADRRARNVRPAAWAQAVGRRWSRNCSRSLFFCILPVAPSGIASTNTTSSGVHHLAILPS